MNYQRNDTAQSWPLWLAVLAFFLGSLAGSYIREGDMALACKETGRYTLKGERYACRQMGP